MSDVKKQLLQEQARRRHREWSYIPSASLRRARRNVYIGAGIMIVSGLALFGLGMVYLASVLKDLQL